MTPFAIRRVLPGEADSVAHVLRVSFNDRLPWLAGLHMLEKDRQFAPSESA